MRFLIQRVSRASVTSNGAVTGRIGQGLLVFIGIAAHDSTLTADYLVDKLISLRIFSEPDGRMNHNVADIDGGLLLISQFTLYADTSRGRRPSFHLAASPAVAQPIYDYIVERVRTYRLKTETGVFGAHMQVDLVNDGPVTLLLEH